MRPRPGCLREGVLTNFRSAHRAQRTPFSYEATKHLPVRRRRTAYPAEGTHDVHTARHAREWRTARSRPSVSKGLVSSAKPFRMESCTNSVS